MSKNKKKIYVGMSGGVDSSVAAALLKEAGHAVTGVHILCWDGCENNQDKQDAMRVAALLDIPFHVWDFRKEYKRDVYEYMVREYQMSRTPNPDVMCNKYIKFGAFLTRALKEGADYVATGHYVRLNARYNSLPQHAVTSPCETRAARSRPRSFSLRSETLPAQAAKGFVKEYNLALVTAKDKNKDQSYFLWTLTQDQLAHTLFPIGDYLKSEVRELAKKFDLPTAAKKDSQGLCFVGNIDFGKFLREALPVTRGVVQTTSGTVIGEHDGAQFYTIGQRHGLAIGGSSEPLYVAAKDVATNTITVAVGDQDPALYRKELFARNIHWIQGNSPSFPLVCHARIRYRQPLQNVTLTHADALFCVFEKPQRAIAPGQSVVFYNGKEMLGGGVIDPVRGREGPQRASASNGID